jgi:hypothetical protein
MRYYSFYKIAGAVLIFFAIIGFFTVADDLRHTGELIGVSSILLVGIILLLTGLNLKIFRRIALQWLALCILLSIPFGGVYLDNMPLGIGTGFIIGMTLAILFGIKKQTNNYQNN